MAVFRLWSPSQEQLWKDWVSSRPPMIQEMCKTHFPNRLYRLTTTGQRVTLESFNEDGTCAVVVDPRFNRDRIFTGHGVFGIKLTDLEECDLPLGVEPDPEEGIH